MHRIPRTNSMPRDHFFKSVSDTLWEMLLLCSLDRVAKASSEDLKTTVFSYYGVSNVLRPSFVSISFKDRRNSNWLFGRYLYYWWILLTVCSMLSIVLHIHRALHKQKISACVSQAQRDRDSHSSRFTEQAWSGHISWVVLAKYLMIISWTQVANESRRIIFW